MTFQGTILLLTVVLAHLTLAAIESLRYSLRMEVAPLQIRLPFPLRWLASKSIYFSLVVTDD